MNLKKIVMDACVAGLIGLSSIPAYSEEEPETNFYSGFLVGNDKFGNVGLEIGCETGDELTGVSLGIGGWLYTGSWDVDSKLARKFIEKLNERDKRIVERDVLPDPDDYYYMEYGIDLVAGIRVKYITFIGRYDRNVRMIGETRGYSCNRGCVSYKPTDLLGYDEGDSTPASGHNKWGYGVRGSIPVGHDGDDSRIYLGIEEYTRLGRVYSIGAIFDLDD